MRVRITAFLALSLTAGSVGRTAPSYHMALKAEPITASKIRFTVLTNAPTPIEVSAGIDLAGQKDSDIAVGYDKFVTLTGSTTVFIMDTTLADHRLPTGRYEARVDYFPNWGARRNAAAGAVPRLTAVKLVMLGGSGVSRASAERRNQLQRWVIQNVSMNAPWSEARYTAKLGPFTKVRSTLSPLHEALYFPDADMTLVVNRLRREITIWRIGRALR